MYNIDRLQLFGAGDVVNYAGDGTRANAGSYNTNTNTTVSTGDLDPEVKEFYDKSLIVLAGPNLVHDQFGQKKPVPQHAGDGVEFRKFSKLPKATTPITEGVTPTGEKLRVTAIHNVPNQYGDYVETTDKLNMVAIDNIKNETVRELADQAGLTLDTVVRNELLGGTNVMYANKLVSNVSTPVTYRGDLNATAKLTVKDVFKAAAELQAVNAPKINGSYVAIIHPYVQYDLMQSAGDTWVDIHKYKNPEAIYRGEIGMIGGVRFVVSTEAKIYGPAPINGGLSRLTVQANASSSTSVEVKERIPAGTGKTIACYVKGLSNTITAIANNATTGGSTLTLSSAVTVSAGDMICGKGAGEDGSAVFCTLFLGANAYGVTELGGGGLEYIAKPLGYGVDPLNQRSSQGWKATKGAVRLVEEYMIRYESGSEMSPTAETN